jgi:hypothetical protein
LGEGVRKVFVFVIDHFTFFRLGKLYRKLDKVHIGQQYKSNQNFVLLANFICLDKQEIFSKIKLDNLFKLHAWFCKASYESFEKYFVYYS